MNGRKDKLTVREEQVLARIRKGLTNKQIADELGLSEKTVKAHVTSLLRGLGVSNRTQAAVSPRSEPAQAIAE